MALFEIFQKEISFLSSVMCPRPYYIHIPSPSGSLSLLVIFTHTSGVPVEYTFCFIGETFGCFGDSLWEGYLGALVGSCWK